MRKSTEKRIKEKLENKPRCFIDASVFVEILLKQRHSERCLDFLHMTRCNYRIVTSTTAMGEVIKAIISEDASIRRLLFMGLEDLAGMASLIIFPVSFESISNVNAIRISDSLVPSSDCLIFSSAFTEGCDTFATLDRHFSAQLGREFHIQIDNPSKN